MPILAGLLGFVPGLAWLFFFLREDARRPEPKGLVISTFALGGLVTFLVLPLQIVTKRMLLAGGVPDANIWHLTALAVLEELLKFGVVYLWISRRKEFDEPIDAMMYMIVAALGFATVENIATVLRSTSGIQLLTLRFVGATLLHCLASGIVGYAWAKGIVRCKEWTYLVWGLALASAFHGIFNYLMIVWGPSGKVTGLLILLAFFVLRDFEDLKRPSFKATGAVCERQF